MKSQQAIGGYFELELHKGEEYHQHAIRLNTARNAFEYILKSKQYKKVYLPYYTCDVMLEPVQKLNLEVQFYSIDETFRPIFDYFTLKDDEVFVYTNYYGICDVQVKEVSQKCTSLIIDNAQAFYSKPLTGIPSFYSPRKFFGVSDGAYLYTDKNLNEILEIDHSNTRFSHLLKRMDGSAEDGYGDFVSNDKSLENNPIKKMSVLTSRLLSSIDYEDIAIKRKKNFEYLNDFLAESNKLQFDLENIGIPLIYPYWGTNELRIKLLEQKIYTATYWPNVIEFAPANSLETRLAKELVHLPIDQRYSKNEMDKIIKIILDN